MERKRVGTITFHVAHNYGAMLQAYALPVALGKMGYNAEVIDYRFPYIYEWGRVNGAKELLKEYGFILGMLKWCNRLVKGVYSPHRKTNKFNYFREKIICHSKKIYSSKKELINMDYDAILFGSDQIWNEELTNGLATEFFGDFPCLEKTKKIAYAASCGKKNFAEKYREKYYSLLKDYVAIGVREKGLAETLNLEGIKAEEVLDPTLLLTINEWNEMLKNSKQYISERSKEYLLVYVFDENEDIYDMVDELAEKNELEVVVIAYNKKKQIEKYCVLTECGPTEFVKLFANAKIIVTTSFHGTVFSIIYHKNFYCIPHPKYHERTDSLLKMLNLEDRNIKEYSEFNNLKMINWDSVEDILIKERNKSIDFLKSSIGE